MISSAWPSRRSPLVTAVVGGFLLCVLGVLSATAQLVSADWNYATNGPDRNNPQGSVVITKYVGPGGAAVVPEVIDGKPVRVVGGGGSAYLDSPGAKLTSVIIPASVRSIGDRAFWKSSNLSSVTIVEGVQTIGFAAFAYTGSLTNIVLPDSVKTLNGYAFYLATNLTGATLGAGLTSMGGTTGADFSNCRKLREIVIPNGVTSIPKLTFDSCTSLANVVLPTGLANIGLAAFARCEQLLSIAIPDSVKQIEQEAFARCLRITNVTFGLGLTNLGREAFAFCDSLTAVTVRGNITTIPESLFDMGGGDTNNPPKLSSVVLPSTVTSVGDYAFADAPRLGVVLFLGAPPSLAGANRDLYGTNQSVVTYYLPGAAGWGSSFAGRATAPFGPQSTGAQKTEAAFSFSWSGPGQMPWPAEVPVGVDRRTSLNSQAWQRIAFPVTNGFFIDPATPEQAAFYRAIYP